MNQTNNPSIDPALKRSIFWIIFIVIVALITWGMIVAGNKASPAANGGVTAIALNKPVTSADWTIGSSTAPVTLVEYADFQCPACAAFHPIVKQLLAEDGAKIYFAYRYFPLPQHANGMTSAGAAEAAGLQGRFWDMQDLLFTNQLNWQDLPDPTSVFVGYATTLGLDKTKFLADMASPSVKTKILASLQDANDNNLDYTPTFFVNGKRIANPAGYAAFKTLIDNAAQSHS